MSDAETTSQTTSTLRDPVCGMTVDPAQARGRAQHLGESYYFCSPGCMHKFVSDPGKYLSTSYQPGDMSTNAHTQIGATCKIERDPVCGMNVDPAKAAASVEQDRKLYHFCCKGCAENFKADPQKYLAPNYKPGGMGAGTVVTIGGATPGIARQPQTRHCMAPKPAPTGSATLTSPTHVSRGARVEACALSQVRHGARARNARRCHAHRVDLSYASRDRAPAAGLLPHLRHGT